MVEQANSIDKDFSCPDKGSYCAKEGFLPDSTKTGLYRLLPAPLLPYAQLARWDRPVGWHLLMWPCFWSFLLATLTDPKKQLFFPFLKESFLTLFLFFVGSVAMRGAACTWNDLVDQEIDRQVARTKERPLPSGRVTRKQALLFMVIQALVGLLVLLQFNTFSIILGLSSLLLIALYPYMKRITYWPQAFLGIVFNWGALLGWAVRKGSLSWPALLLYAGAVLWTIAYDTIYAHQDKEDDMLVGIGSTALLFGERTRPMVAMLFLGFIAFVGAALWCGCAPVFAYLGLLGVFLHCVFQIVTLEIKDPVRCLNLFKANSFIGLILSLGLFLDTILVHL